MNGNGEIDAADLVTATAYTFGARGAKAVSVTTVTQSQGLTILSICFSYA